MRQNNDPTSTKPKGSRGQKWRVYVKPIWDMYKTSEDIEKDGSGTSRAAKPLILPSDPSALLERFDLLVASKQAGNTGVQNEIVSILDELLRQKIIDRNQYKNMLTY